jgi:predicted DNA-binding protein
MARVKIDTLPAVRISPKLKREVMICSENVQENVSEFVRKAVEMRIEKLKESSK